MVLTADQQRVKSLLTETITLLCKNGLHFQTEFSIEGLIGITLDSQDVFLVSIKETVSAPEQPAKQNNNEDSISHRKLGSVNFISQQTRRPKLFEISGANKRRPFVGYRQPIHSAYAQSNSRNVKQNLSSAQNKNEQFNEETAAETLSDSSRYVNDVKWESSSNHQHNKEHAPSQQEDSNDKVAVASHSLDNDNIQSYTTNWDNDITNERSNEGASVESVQQESLRKRRRLSDTVTTDLAEIDSSVNLVDGKDEIGDSGDERNVVEHHKNSSNQKYCDVSEQPTEDSYNSDGPVSDFLKIKEEIVSDDVDPKTASRFDDYMAYLAICGVQTDTQNYQALASSTASSSLSFHTSLASTGSTSIGERGRTNWSSASRSNERGRSMYTSNSDGTPPTSSQVELVTGSGVYVDKMSFHWLEMDIRPKGSKLVRRLVHEIWPDEHVLAMSSCLGQGTNNKGLDQHKVDAIKAYVQYRVPDMSHSKIILAINECCRDARSKLRRWRAGHTTGIDQHLSPAQT